MLNVASYENRCYMLYKTRIDTKLVVLESIFMYLSNKILLARLKLFSILKLLEI